MNMRIRKLKDEEGGDGNTQETERKKRQIEKMSKQFEAKGEVDSDDDSAKRLTNLRDPLLKRFNVYDIMGVENPYENSPRKKSRSPGLKRRHSRDNKGRPLNPKGYLCDPVSGNLLD